MYKVLIVDDSKGMRLLVKLILEAINCRDTYEASNGIEALYQFETHKPDITVLDICMPDVDGISTLKAMRTIDKNATIIMISTRDEALCDKEIISLGASAYICKTEIVERLPQFLSSYQKR